MFLNQILNIFQKILLIKRQCLKINQKVQLWLELGTVLSVSSILICILTFKGIFRNLKSWQNLKFLKFMEPCGNPKSWIVHKIVKYSMSCTESVTVY